MRIDNFTLAMGLVYVNTLVISTIECMSQPSGHNDWASAMDWLAMPPLQTQSANFAVEISSYGLDKRWRDFRNVNLSELDARLV